MTLTHFDAAGQAHMVDVSGQASTAREAVAEGCVVMSKATLALAQGGAAKGDVLGVARLAGIMAAVNSGAIPVIRKSQPRGFFGFARAINSPQGAADRPIAVFVIRNVDSAVSRSTPAAMAPTIATPASTTAKANRTYAHPTDRFGMPP